MAKQYKIRWNESDTQELNRVVRNFNSKINRLIKANPSISNILPEKIQARELKELINTRKDLQRELNALRRFSKRGSEAIVKIKNSDYDLKVTKWQRTELNRRIAIINRRRAKRLSEISNTEMTSRGEALGYTRGQLGMGTPEKVGLLPMKAFTRSMTNRDVKEKFKSVIAQSQSDYFTKRDYQVRENYIKGIKVHYDYENVKDIIEEIESMDIKEFFEIFNKEGATFEISSPPTGKLGNKIKTVEYEAYETALRSTWLPNKGKSNMTNR